MSALAACEVNTIRDQIIDSFAVLYRVRGLGEHRTMDIDAGTATGIGIRELVENSGWIRGLARHLLDDEHLVDDIVQQTLTAALRTPPTDRTRLKSWLNTVTRNFVRLSARERTRRERRESRVARAENVPSHELEVDLQDLRQRVAATVLELDEPYRSTLHRIYYENISVKQIAREQDLPENTIRVRKKRGLEMLRERLEAKQAQHSASWQLSLALLVQLPIDIQEQLAADAARDLAAAAATAAIGASRFARQPLAMGSLIAMLFVLALLSGVALWSRAGDPRTDIVDPLRSGVASARADFEPDPRRPAADPPSPQRGNTREAAHTTASPTVTLATGSGNLRVIDRRTGMPIAGARVATEAANMRSASLSKGRGAVGYLMREHRHDWLGITDERGEIFVAPERLSYDRITVTATGYRELREPTHRRRLSEADVGPYDDGGDRPRATGCYVIALRPVATVRATISLDSGEPAAGQPVRLIASDGSEIDVVSDRDGMVHYAWQAHQYLIRVEREGFVPQQQLASAPEQRVVLARGRVGSGRVVDAAGASVEGARLSLEIPRLWCAPALTITADEVGHFVTPPLPDHGVVTLRVLATNGNAPLSKTIPLPWPPEGIELRVARGARLSGTIRGPRGHGLADARVSLLPIDATSFRARELVQGVTDASGDFALPSAAFGRYIAIVEHEDFVDAEVAVELDTVNPTRFECRLQAGRRFVGRAVDDHGRPVSGVRLQIGVIFGDELRGPLVTTDDTGRFVAQGLPDRATHRPARTDVRWQAISEDLATVRESGALIVQLLRPHQLLAIDGERIPRNGLLGSRNTARIDVERGSAILTVSDAVTDAPRFELVDREGRLVRTATNLVATPIANPSATIGVFAGSDGNPVLLEDPSALADCLIGFWTRRYALEYAYYDAARDRLYDDATIEIVLAPLTSRTLELIDADRQPRANQDVYFSPVVRGREFPVSILLGTTDDSGRLAFDDLASGEYVFSVLATADGDVNPSSKVKPRLLTVVPASATHRLERRFLPDRGIEFTLEY